MKEVQEHLVDFKSKFSKLKETEQNFLDTTTQVTSYFEFSKIQHQKVLHQYEEIEKSLVKMKADMKELYGQITQDTDLKFKKIVIMDTQLNIIKQEQEVMRNKKTKEDSQHKEIEAKHLIQLAQQDKKYKELQQTI